MQKRTAALIAASAAAVAMTVTGVTYASADAPRSASSSREAVRPASAPMDGDSDYNYRGSKKDGGEIQINERLYSANPGACITVVPGAAASFNITNNTNRTVQFFTGPVCDTGAPTATVGAGGSSFGVGAAAPSSFRVV